MATVFFFKQKLSPGWDGGKGVVVEGGEGGGGQASRICILLYHLGRGRLVTPTTYLTSVGDRISSGVKWAPGRRL